MNVRQSLAKTITTVTDGWEGPLDDVHDVPRIVDAILASGWLTERDRAVAEKAWDEGWMQGSIHGDFHEQAGCSNPYTDADDVSVVERVCERLVAEEQAATLARVRALAEWHETKAEKARRFRPEVDGRNPVMDKAAQVHADAARRLRVALDGDGEGEA